MLFSQTFNLFIEEDFCKLMFYMNGIWGVFCFAFHGSLNSGVTSFFSLRAKKLLRTVACIDRYKGGYKRW